MTSDWVIFLKCISLCCVLERSADTEGDISWLKDEEDVDEDRHLIEKVDESSNKLKLKKVQLTDSGVYTCVFENDHGTRRSQYQIYVYSTFHSPAFPKSTIQMVYIQE